MFDYILLARIAKQLLHSVLVTSEIMKVSTTVNVLLSSYNCSKFFSGYRTRRMLWIPLLRHHYNSAHDDFTYLGGLSVDRVHQTLFNTVTSNKSANLLTFKTKVQTKRFSVACRKSQSAVGSKDDWKASITLESPGSALKSRNHSLSRTPFTKM